MHIYSKLPDVVKLQLDAIYQQREEYAVEALPDYQLVYAACLVGGQWRLVTDCNSAFDLYGFTFYPHLCDGRPGLAKAMAEAVRIWLTVLRVGRVRV